MAKLRGIDVSYHQGTIDFNKVKKSNIDFVILREGFRKKIDEKFLEYVTGCNAVGLPIVGVYHFLYSLTEQDAIEEAKSCVANFEKARLGKNVIIFADFEYDTVKKAKDQGITLGKKDCIAHTKAFCEYVESQGYTAGIYANNDYYKNMYDKDLINKYVFWLADYTGEPDQKCVFQQYTEKGKVDGIKSTVDMNYWFKENLSNPSPKKKTIEEIAKEVIAGLWGNGEERKENIIKAGYNYTDVQTKVNELLTPPMKQIIATAKAKKFNKNLIGSYKTTATLNMRNDAGTNNKILTEIPEGTVVKCDGYYNLFNNVKWYYIQFTDKKKNTQYTGFSSSKYLKQI